MRPLTVAPIDPGPPQPDGSRPADPRAARDAALDELKSSLKELLRTLLRRAVGIALDVVENVAGGLERMAASGGLALGGLLGGVRAALSGENPVWGALKGAIGTLSPTARVLLVVALVLAILLLPITVVLVLIALIVLVIVASVAAGRARS